MFELEATLAARSTAWSHPVLAVRGSNVTANVHPLALVLLAPHKTGSTFFTTFLHDLAVSLHLCWYTENAAFMYTPHDRSKCASPTCGHRGQQRAFKIDDRGWGECTTYISAQLKTARLCATLQSVRSAGADECTDGPPSSVQSGVLWGPLRLPRDVYSAAAHVGHKPWQWYIVMHQRDPGDTLVSGYHSFGWTHPAAPGASAQQVRDHTARQASVRNQSADSYALANAADLRHRYAPYLELLQAPLPDVVLVRSRYDHLVIDYARWVRSIVLQLSPSCDAGTLTMLEHRLRERHRASFSPNGAHKRYVRPGRATAELLTVIRAELNRIFSELALFSDTI